MLGTMYPILFHVPTPWGAIPVYAYGVMLGLSLRRQDQRVNNLWLQKSSASAKL